MAKEQGTSSSPEIIRMSSDLSRQLCQGIGYERDDFVAKPLILLADLVAGGEFSLKDIHGQFIERENILRILDGRKTEDGKIQVVLSSNEFGSVGNPGNEKSLVSCLIHVMDQRDMRLKDEKSPFGWGKYDVINKERLRGLVTNEIPVAMVNPRELFHRFTDEVHGNEFPRSEKGVPRVVMTYKGDGAGRHLSYAIDVPQADGRLKRIFDLLFFPDEKNGYEVGKELLDHLRTERLRGGGMEALTVELAALALENNKFPFGAVLRRRDGKLVLARNDTDSNKETHKHAEFLAAEYASGGQVVENGKIIGLESACTFGEPCPSCFQRLEASGTDIVHFLLEQGLEWSARRLLGTTSMKRAGRSMWVVPSYWGFLPPALDLVRRAHEKSGDSPDWNFSEIIAINENRYESGLEMSQLGSERTDLSAKTILQREVDEYNTYS